MTGSRNGGQPLEPIDISGINKATLLMELYNAARPPAVRNWRAPPQRMNKVQAEIILASAGTSFGKLDFRGEARTIAADLAPDRLYGAGYDAANGPNAALVVVRKILREHPAVIHGREKSGLGIEEARPPGTQLRLKLG